MDDHSTGDEFPRTPDDLSSLDLLDSDAHRTQAENSAELYQTVNSKIALAADEGLSHWNTDPSLKDKFVSQEIPLSYSDGDSLVSIVLRKGFDARQYDLPRGRYARALPVNLYVDTSLDPANPHEITRVTLHWSGDHDPNTQTHSYSISRIIHRAGGTAAPESVQVTGSERGEVLAAVMARVERVLEDPHWTSFIDKVKPTTEARTETGPKSEIVNTPEADSVQDIVEDFLLSQNLTPRDLSPDRSAVFSVEHLDELLTEDAGQTVRVSGLVIDRRDDPDNPERPGTQRKYI